MRNRHTTTAREWIYKRGAKEAQRSAAGLLAGAKSPATRERWAGLLAELIRLAGTNHFAEAVKT